MASLSCRRRRRRYSGEPQRKMRDTAQPAICPCSAGRRGAFSGFLRSASGNIALCLVHAPKILRGSDHTQCKMGCCMCGAPHLMGCTWGVGWYACGDVFTGVRSTPPPVCPPPPCGGPMLCFGVCGLDSFLAPPRYPQPSGDETPRRPQTHQAPPRTRRPGRKSESPVVRGGGEVALRRCNSRQGCKLQLGDPCVHGTPGTGRRMGGLVARCAGGSEFSGFSGAHLGAQIRASRRASAPTRRAARARGGGRWDRRWIQNDCVFLIFWPCIHVQNPCFSAVSQFSQFVTGGSKRSGNSGLRTAIRTAARAYSGRANDTDGLWKVRVAETREHREASRASVTESRSARCDVGGTPGGGGL
eukprot:gene24383-biopygen1365